MRRSIQLMIGLLSIFLAVAAGYYGRNAYLYQVSTLEVPVPKQDIPPYTLLTASLFELREFPRAMEDLPYFHSLKDLTGRISTSNLLTGLPVAYSHTATLPDFRLADASLEVLSIPVKPVSAVGGQIRIGERINLYKMSVIQVEEHEPAAGSTVREGQVTLVAGSVRVVDVRSARGEEAGPAQAKGSGESITNEQKDPEQTQILTLAVPPDLVEAILKAVVEAEDAGGLLWASLALP